MMGLAILTTTLLTAQTAPKKSSAAQKAKTSVKKKKPELKVENAEDPEVKAKEDSIKNLFSTYTLTIIPSSPLTDDNAKEIEDIYMKLPTVHYCKVDTKTNSLIVQVRDTPEHKSLVSSELKQVMMDLSGYDVGHTFNKEMKPSLIGR